MTDLSTKYGYCKVSVAPIRAEKRDAAEMVTQLLFGEPIEILEIENSWLKIQSLIDGYIGFVDSKQILKLSFKEVNKWLNDFQIETSAFTQINTPWGVQWISCGSFSSKMEDFKIGNNPFNRITLANNESNSIIEQASIFLNTPYLWGGKSIFGIDCSGYTQLIYRLNDVKLPRDAYQQEEIGQSIIFSEKEIGDLAFFSNESGKVIHVGLIGDKNEIFHASGCVRKDELKSDGIYSLLSGLKTHNLHSIRRYK
jgi:cell wall-associated NlpC family hydrolase